MDEMRADLEALMGSLQPKVHHFDDPDVCKNFLVGFCPLEEFQRTKSDRGECRQVHDESARAEWEALPEAEKRRYPYEQDLIRGLEPYVAELDKRKAMNRDRVKVTNTKPTLLHEDVTKLEALATKARQLQEASEVAAEAGDVDRALDIAEQAEDVIDRRRAHEAAATARAGAAPLRGLQQSVCEVSGLIINSEEGRMRDHESGRTYNAWKKLHEVRGRLLEKLGDASSPAARPGGPPSIAATRGRDQSPRDSSLASPAGANGLSAARAAGRAASSPGRARSPPRSASRGYGRPRSPDRRGGYGGVRSRSPGRRGSYGRSRSPGRRGGYGRSRSPGRRGGYGRSRSPGRRAGYGRSRSPGRRAGYGRSRSPERRGAYGDGGRPRRDWRDEPSRRFRGEEGGRADRDGSGDGGRSSLASGGDSGRRRSPPHRHHANPRGSDEVGAAPATAARGGAPPTRTPPISDDSDEEGQL